MSEKGESSERQTKSLRQRLTETTESLATLGREKDRVDNQLFMMRAKLVCIPRP